MVDDGSRDGTGEVARGDGVRVLRHEFPLGPARARNAGAAATEADILLFVDSDVLVAPGARDRLHAFFVDHPGHVAIFGSYDDAPDVIGSLSRYRNLLHHFVHQQSEPEAATFWTGFGAMRRAAFDASGGFDFAWESIEDVELGLRLTSAGARIRLDRTLLCKHLKEWTLSGMFRTDWKGRAVPWARLLMSKRAGVGDLNLSRSHRASGALVLLMPIGLVLGLAWPSLAWVAPATLGAFLCINAPFLSFLRSRGGISLALRGIAYHLVHYAAADLGYLQVRLARDPRRTPRRSDRP